MIIAKREEERRLPWPRILGFFVAAILMLTMVSRAADALLLPVVKVARPLGNTLTHKVRLNGAIEAREQLPVMAEAGLVVSRVLVRAGQEVKAGDVLVSCDTAAVRQKLEEKQTALKKSNLEAQLKALEQTGTGETQQPLTPQKSDQQKASIGQQLNRLEQDTLQREVDRLTQLVQSGATVVSPVDGVVSEVLVKPGSNVDGAVARISPASSGLVVRAKATGEQAEHLSVGMSARYTLPGETQSREGAVLVGLQVSGEGYEATFELPKGSIGQTAYIAVSQTTGMFSMCVPRSAIAESDGRTGVFRIRTGEGVLGEMEYAEFVPVQVVDSDMENSAIDGSLLDRDWVITQSSKPLRADDRVRSAS